MAIHKGYGWRPTQTRYGLLPQLQAGVHQRPDYEVQRGWVPDPRVLDPEAEAPEAPRYVRPAEQDDSGNIFEDSRRGYANPKQFREWNKSGFKHGYYGDIDDAIRAANTGNVKAKDALTDFYNKGITDQVKGPGGLLGKVIDALGGSNVTPGTYPSNYDIGITLDQLHTQPGAAGFVPTTAYSNQALANQWSNPNLSSETIQAGTFETKPVETWTDWSNDDSDGGWDDNQGGDSGLDSSSDSFESSSGGVGGWT